MTSLAFETDPGPGQHHLKANADTQRPTQTAVAVQPAVPSQPANGSLSPMYDSATSYETVTGSDSQSGGPSAPSGKKPLRVLVAEDNLVNQMVVQGTLENLGHSVVITDNGSEAVEAFCSSLFDVVLMDVQMPVMDGFSATIAIRSFEAHEGRWRTPIVGLTALSSKSDQDRCLAAGMDHHVAKPFNGLVLLKAIEQLTS